MPQTDRLGPLIEVKFTPSAEQGVIEAYGATFNDAPDSYGDVIAPGSFAASLAQHKAAGTAPAMLWSHDQSQPVGKWLSLTEDSYGLRLQGKLTLAVPRAREALALAKDGVLALSIGFRTKEAERTPAGNRRIKAADLFEVSLVALPANPSAKILSVKSAGSGFDPNEIRDPKSFERMLRSLGFSRRFASVVTTAGWKAAAGLRDADDDAHKQLAADIRARASTLRTIIKG